jgi:hypothetical protein
MFADVSRDEIAAHFKTVGIIKEDLETNELMVKVYEDDTGAPKGDAVVHYFQVRLMRLVFFSII